MAQKIKLVTGCLLGIFCSPAFATPISPENSALNLDAVQSYAEFSATGRPSMIKIKGKNARVSGKLIQSDSRFAGQFKVDLDQFNTGIELRDKHMKEKYLETGKEENKYAILTVENFSVPTLILRDGGVEKAATFEGELTLHGIKKKVAGISDIAVKNHFAEGISSFQIKLSDFGIAIPNFAGVKVAEEVNVEVHFQGPVQ